MSCRYVSEDRPRVLKGRHGGACPEQTWHAPLVWVDCEGCQPCTLAHCGTCGHRHVEQITCPECVGEARDNLTEIVRMARAIPGEAAVKGIESEAAHLHGPTASPAAWRQRRRYGYRDLVETRKDGSRFMPDVVGEEHPLWVLGTWDMLVTEHYGHTRTQRITVTTAAAYLGVNLSELAQDEDFAFEDLARDLRRCESHLERVLHDGEQRDTGAPCMRCGNALERVWGADVKRDGWTCPRCREESTEDQYRFAVQHLHREESTHLTDRDMEIRTGVKAGTVREWARRGHVAKRIDSGRVLYAVADVLGRIGQTA